MTEQKESPEEQFKRLAASRVTKALNTVRLIGNLARRPHTQVQTNKIVTALRAAVDEVEYKFAGDKSEKEEEGFSL